jgi:hypothetical protein
MLRKKKQQEDEENYAVRSFINTVIQLLFTAIKSKKVEIVGCEVHVLKVRNASKILMGKPDGKSH